ncbi:MAG: hypothetical protein HFJ80_05545 [Clostridiales bacterium]|nr:hypothetical protein [Clostridiales bacterium]
MADTTIKKGRMGWILAGGLGLLLLALLAASVILWRQLEESRQREYIAEGRTALVAAQTIAAREFALTGETEGIEAAIQHSFRQVAGDGVQVVRIESAMPDENGRLTRFVCQVSRSSGRLYRVTINPVSGDAVCERETASAE